MLQRGTMPTVSARAAELTDSWQESLQREEWLAALRALVHLPATGRDCLIYCIALVFMAGALTTHLLLAVQILEVRVQISQLDSQIARVEQVNSEIVFATAQMTSVTEMMARAKANGYTYTIERNYVAPTQLAEPLAQDPSRVTAEGAPAAHVPAPSELIAGARAAMPTAPSLAQARAGLESAAQDIQLRVRAAGDQLWQRGESIAPRLPLLKPPQFGQP